MQRHLTLEYWQGDGYYAGRVKEIPGIFGEADTLEALEENIIQACRDMVTMKTRAARNEIHTKPIAFEVYYAPGPDQSGNMTG